MVVGESCSHPRSEDREVSLKSVAKAMFEAGMDVDAIRKELRGSPLGHGEPPTCSAVEEAMGEALLEIDRHAVPTDTDRATREE